MKSTSRETVKTVMQFVASVLAAPAKMEREAQ